jgi:hypothetical protein
VLSSEVARRPPRVSSEVGNLVTLGAVARSIALGIVAVLAAASGCGRIDYRAGGADGSAGLDGSALDDSALDGSALDGSALDGSALDGSAGDGDGVDGSALDGGGAGGCLAWSPFSSVLTNLGAPNSALDEWAPAISADGLTVYFTQRDSGGDTDIAFAERADPGAPFGPATRITEVSTAGAEDHPTLTSDELQIFFDRGEFGTVATARRDTRRGRFRPATDLLGLDDMTVGRHGTHLHGDLVLLSTYRYGDDRYIEIAQRPDPSSPFAIVRTIEELRSPGYDGYATLSSDGLEIFFTSDESGRQEIYTARRASTTALFTGRARVDELVVAAVDVVIADPELSSDGTTLYVSANAVGTAGGTDLWSTTRTCLAR